MVAETPVIVLAGATGCGKSDVAVQMAQRLNGEIISVDSVSIYRHLNIGSAKPSPALMAQVPHHLIDICDPNETYSGWRFFQDARRLADDISERGRCSIFVGGTMMFIDLLLRGCHELPDIDEAVRCGVRDDQERAGNDTLYRELADADVQLAQRIGMNDTYRLCRAVEILRGTGHSPSFFFRRARLSAGMNICLMILQPPSDRVRLRGVQQKRIMRMLADGLVNEVVQLIRQWRLSAESTSMRSVGYKQVVDYCNGDIALDALPDAIATATNQLAKRQMTWGRSWMKNPPVASLFMLDAFAEDVIEQAIAVADAFWAQRKCR